MSYQLRLAHLDKENGFFNLVKTRLESSIIRTLSDQCNSEKSLEIENTLSLAEHLTSKMRSNHNYNKMLEKDFYDGDQKTADKIGRLYNIDITDSTSDDVANAVTAKALKIQENVLNQLFKSEKNGVTDIVKAFSDNGFSKLKNVELIKLMLSEDILDKAISSELEKQKLELAFHGNIKTLIKDSVCGFVYDAANQAYKNLMNSMKCEGRNLESDDKRHINDLKAIMDITNKKLHRIVINFK